MASKFAFYVQYFHIVAGKNAAASCGGMVLGELKFVLSVSRKPDMPLHNIKILKRIKLLDKIKVLV